MRLVACLFLATVAAAQGTVSPARLAFVEGNSGNTFPFNQVCRYQQVHGDLRASPMVLRALAFRRDGTTTINPSAIARTLDCDLAVSWASHVGFTAAFDANHGPVKFTAVFRKNISLPDHTQPNGSPAPWTVRFPFDQPTPYAAGPFDLLWDLRVFANTAAIQAYYCDATSEISDVAHGATTTFGTGCTASGRAAAMQAFSQFRVSVTTRELGLAWHVLDATPLLPAWFMLGSPTALTVPGLCTSLYVSPVLTLGGTATAAGTFFIRAIVLPYDPTLVGAQLSAQAASLDPGSTQPFAMALSNRTTTAVPALPPGGGTPIQRLWFNGSTTAERGSMDGASYGLVTAFEQ